jgi:6-phosphogluconolactonase
MIETRLFDDSEALARQAAEWLCTLALRSAGNFAVSLSGGSTPRRLYELLAEAPLPWERLHWFWGDERFVPPDHPDSNYRMAREALLSRAPIAAANVHAMPTQGLSPQQAASAYETTLQRFYGGETLVPRRPLFAVVLLGLGEDGHTASLFPGDSSLEVRDRRAIAVHAPATSTVRDRVTVTLPVIRAARSVLFMVTGASKGWVVASARRVANGPEGAGDAPRMPPAARAFAADETVWLLDRAADGAAGDDLTDR